MRKASKTQGAKQRMTNQFHVAEDRVYLRLKAKSGVEIICEANLITPSYINYVEVHSDNGSFFGSILYSISTDG